MQQCCVSYDLFFINMPYNNITLTQGTKGLYNKVIDVSESKDNV